MRRNTLYVGAVLALASMLVVVLGSATDLGLESVALLGAAMGAVIALVPDGTPMRRLGGFAFGFLIGWAGYFFRAQFMPDTSNGRAVAVGFVVLCCVAVAAGTANRLTLWSVLLGAGAFAGAYEFTYNAAPPEIVSTSLSTATTMAFNVAVGFLATALVAPMVGSAGQSKRRAEEAPTEPGSATVSSPEQPVAAEPKVTTLASFMKETAK